MEDEETLVCPGVYHPHHTRPTTGRFLVVYGFWASCMAGPWDLGGLPVKTERVVWGGRSGQVVVSGVYMGRCRGGCGSQMSSKAS